MVPTEVWIPNALPRNSDETSREISAESDGLMAVAKPLQRANAGMNIQAFIDSPITI
jgi:hypothetical protein